MKILAINGSYRANGFTDQLLYTLSKKLEEGGAEIEQIDLRDYPINFCFNCRECTQREGNAPGKCIQNDAMTPLIDKIEMADAYIFASPTNFGSVTALFKRFMERLVVYGYWPWGMAAPQYRKRHAPKKPAIIITSSAAPGIMARWLFSSVGQLKMTAKTVGAKVNKTLCTGLVSTTPYPEITQAAHRRIQAAANSLLGATVKPK